MKKILIFLLIFVHFEVFSQQVLSFKCTEKPLNEVFAKLSSEYGILFAYDVSAASKVKITVSFRNKKVDEAMDLILAQTNFSYKILSENRILIKKSKKKHKKNHELYNIHGYVYDLNTNIPLPYATIYIENTLIGTTTNIGGYFTLQGLETDTGKLIIKYMGYKPISIKLRNIIVANKKSMEIGLKPIDNKIDEVIIKENNQKLLKIADFTDADFSSVPSHLGNITGIAGNDIFSFIKLLPGIFGVDETNAEFRIQGGKSDQNLIIFDGFTVYQVNHFFGIISAFNSNSIKKINIYKAGFDARYGSRVSGVIDIVGKSANYLKFKNETEINHISISSALEIPVVKNKVSLFISGRRSYMDLFKTSNFNTIYEKILAVPNAYYSADSNSTYTKNQSTTSDIFFYDINMKLSYKISKQTNLSLSYYSGIDNFLFDYDFTYKLPEEQLFYSEKLKESTSYGNSAFSAGFSHQWSDKFFTDLLIAHSSYNNYFNRINNIEYSYNQFPQYNQIYVFTEDKLNKITDNSLKINNEIKLSRQHNLQAGINISIAGLKNIYSIDANYFIDSTIMKNSIYTFFFLDNMSVSDKLKFDVGTRLNYNQLTEKIYTEPRFSLKYSITDKWDIRLAGGTYYQFLGKISAGDIRHDLQEMWLIFDDDFLPVIKSHHFTAGLKFKNKYFSVATNAYLKKYFGITDFYLKYVDVYQIVYQEDIDNFYFTSNVKSRGADFLLLKNRGNFTGWLSVSYNKNNYEYINNPNLADFREYMGNELEIKSLLNYKINKHFTLSAVWNFADNKPAINSIDSYYFMIAGNSKLQYMKVAPEEARKLLIYNRIDLSLTSSLYLKNSSVDIVFSIFNVLNRSNIKIQQYYYSLLDYETQNILRKPQVVAMGLNLVGFMPNISLKFSFF